ncbi:hypothetical protein CW357_16685 [Rummeliibacillus sp. TYF005]|uniref:TIGR04104 family putative zinc finger protein n=1 Tax=Rummeliibacillus sp. TYF005 TaxID=2058214 RepID=UPI000F51CDCE|nr:hypothetical protein CW357_16685 [Rummeliibacillus sp. TYF005]
MATCKHCGHKWGWKETIAQLFSFKRKLKCTNCHTNQYISVKSRNQLSIVGILISLIFVPLISFGVPLRYIITSEILIYVFYIGLIPFLIKLSDQEEVFW